MPDPTTYWPNPGGPERYPGTEGTGVTSTGTDPLVTIDTPNALRPLWPDPPVPLVDGQETPNSVSGLGLQPNRFEPTEQPPEPPSLMDRRPGTIDER
ncbi:MAG TPA: hypothetical protein VIX41_07585 [Acidimicrobiales bacterium]